MELGECGGPDHLWQQGEEGGGGVGNTEVKEKEVHSRYLAVLDENDNNDEYVADEDEDGHVAENTDLHGLIFDKDFSAVCRDIKKGEVVLGILSWLAGWGGGCRGVRHGVLRRSVRILLGFTHWQFSIT